MNLIRRYTLHRFRSRHNPLTRIALTFILCAVVMAAINAASELAELKVVSAADKAMIAELLMFVEGKANLVEPIGDYYVRVGSLEWTLMEVR